ncbi:hypothetical protein RHMOL_Rhmol08G0164100 [Rhododendron molle]|uniref:Uncharacterized protein n=1 Tax=Rhododendron molle TaxID=49168 RepID=A0ACC0MQB5_RHOML|nr:hypothetical protein RHMOL_Rhmol08G0164100 [Rhododendron molle]
MSDDEENEGWQSDEEGILIYKEELDWLRRVAPDIIDIDFDSSDVPLPPVETDIGPYKAHFPNNFEAHLNKLSNSCNSLGYLLYYKALLAPESRIPIPQLGIRDPDTGEQLCEIVVMAPFANKDQPMDVETLSVALGDLAEEIRQEGERWLEIREKVWMEQLREFFRTRPTLVVEL